MRGLGVSILPRHRPAGALRRGAGPVPDRGHQSGAHRGLRLPENVPLTWWERGFLDLFPVSLPRTDGLPCRLSGRRRPAYIPSSDPGACQAAAHAVHHTEIAANLRQPLIQSLKHFRAEPGLGGAAVKDDAGTPRQVLRHFADGKGIVDGAVGGLVGQVGQEVQRPAGIAAAVRWPQEHGIFRKLPSLTAASRRTRRPGAPDGPLPG